ncbi:hypothetical protein QUT02_22500, partial [Xanthomonas citri pv. citri]
QHPAAAGRKQPQHLEGLGPEFDCNAIGRTQLRALLVQLEAGETKQLIPHGVSLAGSYRGSLAKMPGNRT